MNYPTRPDALIGQSDLIDLARDAQEWRSLIAALDLADNASYTSVLTRIRRLEDQLYECQRTPEISP